MNLSVIIVNYNVQYFLEQCLRSVNKACRGLDCEVFVVDNNSSDGSVEMVRMRFPEVKLIINKENKGFSAANNQAIKQATGKYILLLNPDTVVEEDTFIKSCKFLDANKNAGALGVQMIDGKGVFLPESKRGLPTPAVAFYKIFGLSALFPHSKTFGRYHLGFLAKDKTHEVDVLSGAFMMIRKEVLDKIGFLDETFFMYGEDIDLSYRITQAGFKNYYFHETRIIHYKGESTKKSSVNYVFVFYRAMAIFAKKHFAKRNAALFGFLIQFAIYIRAGAAILKRTAAKILLPLTDAVVIYSGMYFLKRYWEFTVKDVHYPDLFMDIVVPLYIFTWLVSAYLSGGYDKPYRLSRMIRGVFSGTIFILVIYALLPENYRFSRALILLGAAFASMATMAIRILFHWLRISRLAVSENKRLLIVGDTNESQRILSLLQMSGNISNFIGYVSAKKNEKDDPLQKFYLGNADTLNDIISLYEVNEVIFCSRDFTSQQIIDHMLQTTMQNVEFKIAPPESLYIIGSNSINDQGSFYFVDINAINQPANKRNKRMFDVIASLLFLIFSPVLIFIQKSKGGFYRNIFMVLFAKASWVGFSQKLLSKSFKPGILSPSDIYKNIDPATSDRIESLYAKEYKPFNDLRIVMKSLYWLGNEKIL